MSGAAIESDSSFQNKDLLNRGLNTTGGMLYLVEIDTAVRLEIQFVPEELSFGGVTRIGEIQILGRNTPRYQYLGGEALLSFQLDFYADEESRQSVIQKCRWLEKLKQNDGYRKGPSKVSLVFGKLFNAQSWIVKSFEYKVGNFSKPKGFLPQQAYGNLVLALDPESNLLWEDISPEVFLGDSDGNHPFLFGQARESDEQQADFTNAKDGISLQDFINTLNPF